MKLPARTALILVGSALLAALLIYRHRSIGVAPRAVASKPRTNNRTTIPFVNSPYYGPPTPKAITENARSRPTRPDWRSQFAASHNLFAFVKRAAGPAFHGDGAAALYVSRALAKCATAIVEFGGKNPEAALQNFILTHTNGPRAEEHIRRYFDLCKGFFNGNAFAALPTRKDGYFSYSYWMNQAYEAHNPIAEVNHVGTLLPVTGNGTNAQVIGNAEKTLVSAVASGDPQAVFDAGVLLVNSHGSNIIRAFAVSMAGCDMGYDCSANNDQLFGDCAKAGTCPPGETFSDMVSHAVGPAGYAKAYAMAEQLKFAISQGDTATISQYVQLKH